MKKENNILNKKKIKELAKMLVCSTMDYLASQIENEDGVTLSEIHRAMKFAIYSYSTCLQLSLSELNYLCENVIDETEKILETYDKKYSLENDDEEMEEKMEEKMGEEMELEKNTIIYDFTTKAKIQ